MGEIRPILPNTRKSIDSNPSPRAEEKRIFSLLERSAFAATSTSIRYPGETAESTIQNAVKNDFTEVKNDEENRTDLTIAATHPADSGMEILNCIE